MIGKIMCCKTGNITHFDVTDSSPELCLYGDGCSLHARDDASATRVEQDFSNSLSCGVQGSLGPPLASLYITPNGIVFSFLFCRVGHPGRGGGMPQASGPSHPAGVTPGLSGHGSNQRWKFMDDTGKLRKVSGRLFTEPSATLRC